MSHQCIELLRKAFPELPDAVLADLSQRVRERTYPMGTVLCTEGQAEDTFYIICSGRVAVSKYLDGETSRILAYQGPGEFFGELGLIQQDNLRVATVVVTEETRVLELDKKDFIELLESSPPMVVVIMRAVASRLRDADQRSIAELRRKNKELGQAYRQLEAEARHRSTFLTSVAHELRSPLTVVKDQLDALEPDSPTDEAVQSVISSVSDRVDDIVQLVNSILFLQELDLIEPQFRPVSIEQLVRQVVDEIQPNAERANLTLHLDIAPEPGMIMGDPVSLKQAVIGLLQAAVKFSPSGGHIHVSVCPDKRSLQVAVHIPDRYIPPESIERLYSTSWQQDPTDHVLGRLGIGLPLAKAVVEQHKGSIHIESEQEQGSTFAIHLPR